MSQHKWQVGPVKLVSGEDAFIDAINEGQEHWRYTGRIKNKDGMMIACGWHACGRMMYATSDSPTSLAPPPKKKVRVKCWLVVYPNGNTCRYIVEEDALVEANRLGFALIEIDLEVEEGEGL